MDNNDIIELIRKEGILVAEPVNMDEEALLLNIDGEELCFYLSEGSRAYYVLPHYKGNRGFFHVFSDGGECLLLKSCYEDFVRIFKKSSALSEENLAGLSRTLLKIEGILKEPYGLWLIHNSYDTYFVKAKEISFTPDEHVDPRIPRPLTNVEYASAQDTYSKDSTMFSRSLFNTVTPENISYLGSSVLKKYPDIMHTFFNALELKAQSPSAKTIAGRAYLNISGMLAALKESKISVKTLTQEYMPWQKLFENDKDIKPELFISSNVPMNEIAEFIDELEGKTQHVPNMLDDSNVEQLIHLTMMALIVCFMFYEQWRYLSNVAKLPQSECLKWVYKTRVNSFFVKGASLHLPRFFDPALDSMEVEIKAGAEVLSVSEAPFKSLFHKKTIYKTVDMLHETLDMRDRLLSVAGRFHKSVKSSLDNNSAFLTQKERIKAAADIFLFDMDEISKLVHDSYFPGFEQIVEYRKSFGYRLTAQAAPYEIYEGDIPSAAMIVEEQLIKGEEKKAFGCKSFNHKPAQVEIGAVGVLCARVFPLADIAAFSQKPAAVITDLSPAFSYLTEYCMMNDVPLYTGLRQCEFLLKGKKTELTENEIRLV